MTDRLDQPQRYRSILEGLLREHVPGVWIEANLNTLGFHPGPEDSRR